MYFLACSKLTWELGNVNYVNNQPKYQTGFHDDTGDMQQQKVLKLHKGQDQVQYLKVILQP
jgi:hypothetical protein